MPHAAMEPRSIRLSRTQACVLLALGFPPVLSPSCTQYQAECTVSCTIYLMIWSCTMGTHYEYLTGRSPAKGACPGLDFGRPASAKCGPGLTGVVGVTYG